MPMLSCSACGHVMAEREDGLWACPCGLQNSLDDSPYERQPWWFEDDQQEEVAHVA